jgi:DNA-binding NtrC family response regulator
MSQLPDSHVSLANPTRRMLVVDDEPTLRLGFAYALAGEDHVVETAGTGRQALDTLAAREFDIVILDLRMPDIDGLGVIERLRSKGNQIPVVLCTAALTPASALRAIQCNVVDFLMKPVRPADLRSIVDFVLEPGAMPFELAMQAAREGDLDEAIAELTRVPSGDFRAATWMDFFRLVRDGGEDVEEEAVRRLNRVGLAALAFRASQF